MTFVASLACALIVLVLILRAWGQRNLLKPLLPATAAPERVAVIVPARDEEENIGPCLQSLIAQDYPADALSIVAIDDSSSDSTPEIIAGLAEQNPSLHALHSPALSKGWTGKCQACWVAAQSVAPDVEWLCFIDADMRAEPQLIASALAAARAQRTDLLSLAPRHLLVSFAERLMIPCGLFFLAFYQDLKRKQAPGSSDVSVTGQFMLVRHDIYREVGGHAAVRGYICEDLALGALVKRAGHNVLLMDGTRLISTRMYRGWQGLWEGFSKNLTDTFGGPMRTLFCAAAAVVIAWELVLMPFADWISLQHHVWGATTALALALLAFSAILALHIAGTMKFRIPIWYALLFPLGYSIGALMAMDSLRRRVTRRVPWKGRIYR